MRLPLLLCVTTLAASAALAQQAGSPTPSSPSSKSTQTDPSSQPGISSSPSSSSSSSIYSPTGRGGQAQQFRSTKIIGAPVKSSTGEEVGRIEDVTLNPTTGRIEFAVISAESKLVPVPWQLLSVSSSGASAQASTSSSRSSTSTSTDPSSTTTPGASGTYASASAGGQPSLVLNVEKSKLQAAPSFERSRWPEMSASWSQGVYSHFGVSPSAVGGTGAGSFRSPSSQGSSTTPDQGSTGTGTDSSSGKASSDPSKSSSDDKK